MRYSSEFVAKERDRLYDILNNSDNIEIISDKYFAIDLAHDILGYNTIEYNIKDITKYVTSELPKIYKIVGLEIVEGLTYASLS